MSLNPTDFTMKCFFLLLLSVMSFCSAEDPPQSADAILAEAKAVLMAGQKGLVDAEAERVARAIAAIDALLAAQQPQPAGGKLDPKDLKRIIKAKFTAKGERGDEVTMVYSTWSANELADWTVTGPDPVVSKNGLMIPPGSTLTHKVRFGTAMKVSGDVALANKLGTHLASTGGLELSVHSYNAWIVGAKWSGKDIGQATYDGRYTITDGSGDWIPFTVALQKGVFSMNWKDQRLGAANSNPFGFLVLHGGTGGNTFRNITVTGTLEPEWVQQALEQAAVDAAMAAPVKGK